jgi:hypothetical protein
MRILLEQSGYDLRNVGDAAMLESAIRRIRQYWPDAHLDVVCYDSQGLMHLDPTAHQLSYQYADRPPFSSLPRRVRLGGEQALKTLSPYIPVRRATTAKTLRQAIAQADLVIAAGGGYVCDPFWWHGVGVLSVLQAAQRRGIPTVMLGQGIGPLTHRALRLQARTVLNRLDVLTLREGLSGPALLAELGCIPADEVDERAEPLGRRWRLKGGGEAWVTGDDALMAMFEDHPEPSPRPESPVLGVNIRTGSYAGRAWPRVHPRRCATCCGTWLAVTMRVFEPFRCPCMRAPMIFAMSSSFCCRCPQT